MHSMYSNNFISMGFGCCHCRHCRHVHPYRKGYKKYYNWRCEIRKLQYRKVIKKLRQAKHKEELPNRLFNLMRYTD